MIVAETDEELMIRVKMNDTAAFNLLYQRYEARLRSYLQRLGLDLDEASDCVQESFMRLWLSRAGYEPTGSFAAYLYKITRNCRFTSLRKRKSRPEEVQTGQTPEWNEMTHRETSLPEEHIIAEYRKLKIREAVQSIPEPYRTCLVMAHLEEMKYTEIAEKLEIPVGTVKSRINTAMTLLRERLKENMI